MCSFVVLLLALCIAPSLSFVVTTVRPHNSNSIGDDQNQKPIIHETYPIAADNNILKIPSRGVEPKKNLPEVNNYVGLQQDKHVGGLYLDGSTINMEPEGDNTLNEDTRTNNERKMSYTDAVMALALWHLTNAMNDYQVQRENLSSETPMMMAPTQPIQ